MRPCVVCNKVAEGMRYSKHACCSKCLDYLLEQFVKHKEIENPTRPWWVE